jgi:CMP-N-acetylneuraminic acid synthetase
MINGYRIMALIPARGGSKGIKNKNIKKLNGVPLIAHTIKQAINVDIIDDIVVSTDDNNIKKIALKYGARVPFKRPDKLSNDNATNIDVALHAIKKIKSDILIILQPTSPLRKSSDITSSLKLLLNKNVKAVIGVNKNKSYVYSFQTNNSKLIQNAENISKISTNRQDHQDYFSVNGAIYAAFTNFFIHKKTFFTNNTCIYEMPIHRSVDIDEMNDWKLVEKILSD